MRLLSRICIIGSVLLIAPVYAGTINAPYYFDQDCLMHISHETIPTKFEFACDQDGHCFVEDRVLNYLLNCAKPFGTQPLNSNIMKSYYLTSKGFAKK